MSTSPTPIVSIDSDTLVTVSGGEQLPRDTRPPRNPGIPGFPLPTGTGPTFPYPRPLEPTFPSGSGPTIFNPLDAVGSTLGGGSPTRPR